MDKQPLLSGDRASILGKEIGPELALNNVDEGSEMEYQPNQMEFWHNALVVNHHIALLVAFGTGLAIWLHIIIYHWVQGHTIGTVPVLMNGLRDVLGEPVSTFSTLTSLPLGYVLGVIPILFGIFHGIVRDEANFTSYFYGNIIHGMGPLKYVLFACCHFIGYMVTIALLGENVLSSLIFIGVAWWMVYIALHILDMANGDNNRTYSSNLISFQAAAVYSAGKALESMPKTSVVMPSGASFSSEKGQQILQSVEGHLERANIHHEKLSGGPAENFVYTADDASDSIIDDSADALKIGKRGLVSLALVPGQVLNALFGMAHGSVRKSDIPFTGYPLVLFSAIMLTVVVYYYYISACIHVGFTDLPWIAHFAFYWSQVPIIYEVVEKSLVMAESSLVDVYAKRELSGLIAHGFYFLVFVNVIYWGSISFGNLYV